MNFVLPQFIEMETKIVGPLTLRQFVFVGGGGGVSMMLYIISTATPASQKSFPLPVCIALDLLIMGAAFTLAFVKINGIGLPTVIKHYFEYSVAPKIYLWGKFPFQRTVNLNQAPIKYEKAPTDKRANMMTKKSELKKLRNFIQTKS